MKLLPLSRPLGLVVYQGPSMLDRAPIVVVLTGFRPSGNRKTGKMLQAWILRSRISPVEAVNSDRDFSVCGDCKHRGFFIDRTCYVVVPQAPLVVYKTYKMGRYVDVRSWTKRELETVLSGRKIRFGAYGDPAAAPIDLWRRLAAVAGGWTGYTHQWQRHRAQGLAQFVMASVDSAEEAAEAESLGWRTFRVRTGFESLADDEVVCPAAPEGGSRTTCEQCGLCRGQSSVAKNISILAHGHGAAKFSAAREKELALT